MVGSAIDDIFAGKRKSGGGGSSTPAKATTKADSPSSAASGSKSKAKKSAKKQTEQHKAHSAHSTGNGKAKAVDGKPEKAAKRQKVETIVDPSKKVEAAARASAKAAASSSFSKGGSTKRLAAEDEEFRDTRGQNRRKTDDGLAIYSEAELKLDSKGGDTPLCPFDCECCY